MKKRNGPPQKPVDHDRRRVVVRGMVIVGGVIAAGPAAAAACVPTRSDILGPFHRPAAPFAAFRLADESEPGQRLLIEGRVLDEDCATALPNAVLDVWQADAAGRYDMPDYVRAVADTRTYRLRRQFQVDQDGRFSLETIVPGRYEIPPGLPGFEQYAGQTRPAHIHLIAIHPMRAPLITQLYFAGDPFIADDPWARDSANVLPIEPDGAGADRLRAPLDIILSRRPNAA